MIAEFFYPKELKDVVASLRDKNKLNEQALNVLNTGLYVYYFLWLLGLIVVFFNVSIDTALMALLVSFVVLIIFSFVSVRYAYTSRMAAYIYGERMRCTVKTVYSRGMGRPLRELKVYLESVGKSIRIGPFPTLNIGNEFPQTDQLIFVYYTDDKKYRTVLGTQTFMQNYCLDSSKIKGNIDD